MSITGRWRIGCVTGQILGAGDGDYWQGHDEMDEAQGDRWAEIQPDGSISGHICFHTGDEADFIARNWTTSTAC
jgi:hypothetical protein